MLFDPLFERFATGTPLTVMTRALLENTLQAQPLDDLFERLAIKQYTRELLFSTVVATMTLVACRFYKSPRSVYAEHSVHGSAKVEEEVSLPKVAEHVSRNYEGMLVGLPVVEWVRFRSLNAKEMAKCLRQWAAKVSLEKVRKAKSRPRKKGGPKPVHDPSTPHVSTARLLAARRQQQ